ncbi:unnamed protein product [Linum tenue]|uniref:Uncharacterized protein n=1 Tax=Linum tenue TaxID=586396 RepID=A0AAV0N7Y0_9ROSI|nr:unnamed protein product [Linum tenue]
MDDKDEGAGKKAASTPFFPSLKELELCQCPRLKGRRRKPLQFPKLSKLLIAHCFVLTSMPSFPTLDMELVLRSSGIQPLLDTLAMSSAGHINVPSTASCSSSSSSSPSSSSEVETLQYPLSKLKKKLHISGIDHLPKEWLQGMQHLTSLQEIRIDNCLGLEETLNWHNISHVPNITIDGFLISQDGRSPWDEDHWNNFPRILQMISEEKAKKEGQAESSR